MPVFYILVVIGIIILFFLLSFAYKGIGKLFNKTVGDAVEIMKEKEEEKKE